MRYRITLALLALLADTGEVRADAFSSTPPPTPLPASLRDVGAQTTLPFVIACMGQSNAVGQDHSGSKTIGANIFVTNTVLNVSTTPTALVPAAFGTAPLNLTVGGGVTTDPALAYNNMCVQAATTLRASATIPDTRPIVILLNAYGAQSITDWVDASPPINMWTLFNAGMAVVTAAYPGATLNHVIWAQGENDSSGTYGTQATYGAAFATLMSELTALPQWTSDTRMTVQQLGLWNTQTQGQRNDFLKTLSSGNVYPAVTLVSASGMTESTDNPIPHFSGTSLVTLGQRHFQAWAAGGARHNYSGPTGYNGSAYAWANALVIPSGATTLGLDDLMTGAVLNLASGAAVTLPNAAFLYNPIIVYSTGATSINTPGVSILAENTGTSVSSIGLKTAAYIFTPVAGQWLMTSFGPKVGGMVDCFQNSSFTANAAQSLGSKQWQGCIFTGSGNAVALTVGFGLRSVFINQSTASQNMVITPSAGSMFLPDGSTAATYSIPPGGMAMIEGGITGTSTAATYVLWDTSYAAFKGYATASRPTCTAVGTHIMDVTLHIPEWCDGTAWRDATGTVR